MNIFGKFKKHKWFWIVCVLFIIGIRLWAFNSYRIENFYTNSFYSSFSAILRFLFGWIPFSVGDILYFIAACWLFGKIIKNIKSGFRVKFNRILFINKIYRFIFLCTVIYIVFNIFWGLNYNRKGIAWQLHLSAVPYDSVNLKVMQNLLLHKVNNTKKILVNGNVSYPDKKELFARAVKCYNEAAALYPFMKYKLSSVKSSMYGYLGDYLGFTGYYNPFTGEAQVNTTVPKFLIPYITLHEMGHQLGYAKEDEANFSGYLAAANSHDTLFQYSTYLDLFVYASREVYYFDSTTSKIAVTQLIPEVKEDLLEWKRFNRRYTNFFEPGISWLYGKYLQVNQQPHGLHSYNEVIATLMAYYKKYGKI
jgi:uncharacterized protein DUF3810